MSSKQREMSEPVSALPKPGSQELLHEASRDLTGRIGEIGRRIETGDGSDHIASCCHPLTKKLISASIGGHAPDPRDRHIISHVESSPISQLHEGSWQHAAHRTRWPA